MDFFEKAKCAKEKSVDFFPSSGSLVAKAIKYCEDCSIRIECRDYAIKHELMGVWGGTSERERKRMKKLEKAS